jgi:hypothetical protein
MILLQRGAVAAFVDRAGWTALHIGAMHGHAAVVQPLLAAAELASPGGKDWLLLAPTPTDLQTPLHLAAFNGQTTVLAALVAAGAPLEAVDLTERTALQLAAQKGHAAAARQLISAKAELNALDQDTATALHAAAYFGHAEVIGDLLRAGADPLRTNRDGFSPLHFAVTARQPAAAASLLVGGASTTAETVDHLTPAGLVHEIQRLSSATKDPESPAQERLAEVEEILEAWGSGSLNASSLLPGDSLYLCSSTRLVRALFDHVRGEVSARSLKWTTKKTKRLGGPCTFRNLDQGLATVEYSDGKTAAWPIAALRRREAAESATHKVAHQTRTEL